MRAHIDLCLDLCADLKRSTNPVTTLRLTHAHCLWVVGRRRPGRPAELLPLSKQRRLHSQQQHQRELVGLGSAPRPSDIPGARAAAVGEACHQCPHSPRPLLPSYPAEEEEASHQA